jgi:phosphatidylinositol alpha-1,6-mannosyltransferase
LRLMILSDEFPPGPGGIGTHAYHLAAEITRLGADVLVLSPQDHFPAHQIPEFNRAQPFRVVPFKHPPTRLVQGLYRCHLALRAIDEFKPDVVVGTGERAMWIVSALSCVRRFKWIAVGHGLEFGVRSRWRIALTRHACHRSDAVVVVSNYTARRMSLAGIRPKRAEVIHNGADSGFFGEAGQGKVIQFRRELGLHGSRVLLTVGNVTERKGQDVIVRSLPYLLKAVPETVYLMVGLATDAGKLTTLATRLGVASAVRFLGRIDRDALLLAYNACDLFVMTSRHSRGGDFEGHGIAVLEAALCAKAAVVSGDSGLQEAVIDSQTGVVVPPDQPRETAEAIIGLLTDDDRRRRLGRQARARALQESTWAISISRYASLLEELVGRPEVLHS